MARFVTFQTPTTNQSSSSNSLLIQLLEVLSFEWHYPSIPHFQLVLEAGSGGAWLGQGGTFAMGVPQELLEGYHQVPARGEGGGMGEGRGGAGIFVVLTNVNN